MNEKIKKRLTKNQILTIPNLLSMVRLLLIPVIMVLYLHYDKYVFAAIVIVISGITDVVDGIIARKFNMISDLGKVLDPLADKLTQIAMVVCIAINTPYVFFLVGILIIKDLLLFLLGLFVLKKTDTVNSSRWYGKVCTVIIYSSMFALFLFPKIDPTIVGILFSVCSAFAVVSIIGYAVFYGKILIKSKKDRV